MNVEMMAIDRVIPYARNPRKNAAAVPKVAAAIREFGWRQPIVVDESMVIIVGHTRLEAARVLGQTEVPVHIARGLSPQQVKAYRLADNRIAEEAEWDDEMLSIELQDLDSAEFPLDLTGFDGDELDRLLADETGGEDAAGEDVVEDPPADPITRPGDLIIMGRHRLICGDARDTGVVAQLLGRRKVNLAVTSPPYASQRKYDPSSAFRPIPPLEYGGWYRGVAALIWEHLASDGSYVLNIKEHSENGQRHLYVIDLLISHVREWGWRWVDTFIWRDTRNGVPGAWPNRFKDAWEPCFHFARSPEIKFRPLANGVESDSVFDYSPENEKSSSGSGLVGARAEPDREGIARPSNVLEISAGGTGEHSAQFPVDLPAWFIRAFTDEGDLVYDPFVGSGTTIIACEQEGRDGAGCEISPAFCDVVVTRWERLTGQSATRPVR